MLLVVIVLACQKCFSSYSFSMPTKFSINLYCFSMDTIWLQRRDPPLGLPCPKNMERARTRKRLHTLSDCAWHKIGEMEKISLFAYNHQRKTMALLLMESFLLFTVLLVNGGSWYLRMKGVIQMSWGLSKGDTKSYLGTGKQRCCRRFWQSRIRAVTGNPHSKNREYYWKRKEPVT